MSKQFDKVKVLEQCRISPPPNSVPTTIVPLTFFDIDFMFVHPMQSVFLYRTASVSAAECVKESLPQLKNSLSLALQRFFPLCGNCVSPPHPLEPYILYKDGDSVPFLVAQCTGNFSDFLQYAPTDAKPLRLLVPPKLPKVRVSDDDALKEMELTSLLSVQVTIFPNSGLCIGITHHHVAADAMSLIHFVKTWASICKSKCDMSNVSINLPVHDKGFIKDPEGIRNFRLNQWRALGLGSPVCNDSIPLDEDRVRAILTMSRFNIYQLKKWISAKCSNGLYLSSFVVISAFLWVIVIRTLDRITTDRVLKDEELCHFTVVADCRHNYGMTAFFGNCLSGKLVSVTRSIFREEDCIAKIAEAVSHCVQSFKTVEVKSIDPKEFPKWEEALTKGENILTITSSPKQFAYETDFGWGRPEKVDAVHIDASGSITLSQSRIEEGGIEVGICRSRHEMEVFTSIFEASINQFGYRAML